MPYETEVLGLSRGRDDRQAALGLLTKLPGGFFFFFFSLLSLYKAQPGDAAFAL